MQCCAEEQRHNSQTLLLALFTPLPSAFTWFALDLGDLTLVGAEERRNAKIISRASYQVHRRLINKLEVDFLGEASKKKG